MATTRGVTVAAVIALVAVINRRGAVVDGGLNVNRPWLLIHHLGLLLVHRLRGRGLNLRGRYIDLLGRRRRGRGLHAGRHIYRARDRYHGALLLALLLPLLLATLLHAHAAALLATLHGVAALLATLVAR